MPVLFREIESKIIFCKTAYEIANQNLWILTVLKHFYKILDVKFAPVLLSKEVE
jgi:hypothetical protein